MAPPKPVKKPSPDAIALSQLNGLGLAPADVQSIRGLDQNRDNYLDAGEVGKGLLSQAAPVVGRLFAAGVGRPLIDRGLVTTFKNLNSPQQFSLLQKLSSPAQAQLLHGLSQQAPASDLHYIWYQFVKAESGVLGGVLLNHLRAIQSPLADTLPKAAEAALGGTEFRKQLQDHLKVAHSVKNQSVTVLRYFPSADEARPFLQSQGVTIANGKAPFPPALSAIAPHIRGPFPQGAVAVIHEGRGFIRIPKPQFFPKEYAVEVAGRSRNRELEKRYEAGRQLTEEGRHDDAIQYFEKMQAENPEDPRAQFEIGLVHNDRYNKTGDQAVLRKDIQSHESAMAKWEALLARDPNYFDTRSHDRIHFEYTKESLPILYSELK